MLLHLDRDQAENHQGEKTCACDKQTFSCSHAGVGLVILSTVFKIMTLEKLKDSKATFSKSAVC